MPNSLGPTGLTVATQSELVANFTAAFQLIYGTDINLDQDSPDGQMMYIFIQAVLDLQDLLVQIYNTFDPDNAFGVVLDQRLAINGIQRQAGTYSVTNVTVVTSIACSLYGLDQAIQPVYTVQDNAGFKWELMTTQFIAGPGTYVFSFRAALPGATLTTPGTIKIPVTIVLGVVSVNNPTAITTVGINEETDAVAKVRRQQSVSLASQGYLKGLLAALKNINGVTSAFVYENTTGTTNSDGVPGHSIWVIVAGSAASLDIATAIYTKRNAGCGMYGSNSYIITQVDGSQFIVYWDTVVAQNLYTSFAVTSIDGINLPNIAAIRSGLVNIFNPGVNQEVNVNSLATLVQAIDPNSLVTNAGFTTGLSQVMTLSGVAASGTFVIKYNGVPSAAINWNDSIATVQTKVQAITGLAGAVVSGSIASQTLSFNLNALGSTASLLTVASNSLVTSVPAPITFSYNENYSVILSPSSKKFQFAIASSNIIITPMILSPYNPIQGTPIQVTHLLTQQFAGLGGYGPYTYTVSINNSGSSGISTSGVYTAGAVTGVQDTILVVDTLGNSATALVQVI